MPEHARLLELSVLFKNLLRKMTNEWNKRMEDGMSISQFRTLLVLSEKGPQKTAELADKICLTPGAITTLADKLIAKGLIERERSEEDRRIVYLRITEQGQSVLETLLEKQRETIAQLFRNLSDEDIDHLQRIFSHMLDGGEQTDKPVE
jgi:DNA-binding MarR family transcriptional regulator